ncbi:hypothetical protein Trydic_g4068 [Trypoxylus dichotomus]
MDLYTNENNPAALKILIAANFSKTAINVKTVQTNDKKLEEPKILPYLEIATNRTIFMANAAARYLFTPERHEDECEHWVSWESIILTPLIVQVGANTKSDTLKTSLISCLKYLNENIKGNTSLIDNTIQVCDIIIWSTLYPLYNDHSLANEYLSKFADLNGWLKLLESKEEFQKALNTMKVTAGISAYSALVNGLRCTPTVPLNLSISGVNTSPQHAVEAVTTEEINAVKEAWFGNAPKVPQTQDETYPVLPKPGERNILITSALPYVNNVPHLGNIIGCVLSADVFARFSRLCNYNTLFICGTDEYGTATETKALEEGLTPQQICDKYFEIHNSIYRWFNIGFDYFGRTTTPEQTKIVQEMFLTLNNNGFMQIQAVDQLLCENCNRYLADRFVEGVCPHPGCNYEDARGDQCDGCGKLVNAVELRNPRCKVCSKAPVLRSSQQYFLDLPKLEPLLLHWMEKSAPGWSHNASVIGKSWMKEGLKPRCITRDLKWGVPVPIESFKDKVFYVWFDAPIGYMSITQRYTKEWEKWWRPEPDTEVSLYQFMAKDNVPFHSVMFPAVLLGANKNYITVSHIMATEYLNYEDGKFSKSRGIGVFGNDAQDTGIPSDVWRFYLLYIRPEGQDSSFSWVDLATKCNSELLNNFGNFVNRALMFTEKFFNSTVPITKPTEDDFTFLAFCTRELKGYISSLEKAKLRDGIRYILAISRHGNQYVQSAQPWVLVKGTDEQKERAATIIGICCNVTYLLATLLYPYMPEASRAIKDQLNVDKLSVIDPGNPVIINLLQPGHKIGKPAPLFTKIEQDRLEELKKRFAGKQTSNATNKKDIDVDTLEKAIKEQADKVRSMKSSGVDKTLWQPEVTILLNLKKQLEATQKNDEKVPTEGPQNQINSVNGIDDVKMLEEEIQSQGLVVRKLKESGASKAEWQPQVEVLLALKGKLASLTGQPLAPPGKGKKGKK